MYTNYDFYIEKYLLGQSAAIHATDFPFWCRKAEQVLNIFTFNCLHKEETIIEPVQMCCCELAEHIYNKEKQAKKTNGIKSEKVDDYSITYEDKTALETEYKQKEKEIIHHWLGDTDLLYRGV